MLGVKLICVGKLRERHYISACGEYEKRLAAYCRFETVELPEQRLPENPSEREIALALEREGEQILKAAAGYRLTALCVEGDELSSEALARRLSDWAGAGHSRLCFVIGGSFGLSQEVKRAAALRLSMSKMTFPHHLARVMLEEQLYRAFSINANSKYHK